MQVLFNIYRKFIGETYIVAFEKDLDLHDKLRALMVKDKENVTKIVNDPIKQYRLFRNRLENEGVNAPIPEFEMMVEWFFLYIKSHEALYEQTTIDPFLAYKKNQLLDKLQIIKGV